MKSLRFLLPLFGLILPVYIITTSCKAGRPERKMLPDQFAGRGIKEDNWKSVDARANSANYISPDLPFYASDTTISGKEFTAIYLRNPEFDSLAFSIIKSYEPFAGSLLNIMAEQSIKGILVDLRQNTDIGSGQADFRVANHNDQSLETGKPTSINIVFLWDELSSSRAEGFMNELRSSALLTVKDLTNKNPYSSAYKLDCFSPASPDFDEQ